MRNLLIDVIYLLQRNPSRIILREVTCSGGKSISSQQFYDMMGAAFAKINNLGIRQGERVVLCSENSGAQLAVDLAIFASGAVNVLLNNKLRFDEILDIIKDAGARLIITDNKDLLDYLHKKAKNLKTLSTGDAVSGQSVKISLPLTDPLLPVLLDYKFDLTGHPLGVVLTGKNLNFILPVLRETIMEYRALNLMQLGHCHYFHYLPMHILPARLIVYTMLTRNHTLLINMQPEEIETILPQLAPHCFFSVPEALYRIKNSLEKRINKSKFQHWLYKKGIEAYNRKYEGERILSSSLRYNLIKILLFNRLRKSISSRLKFILNGMHPLSEENQKWFHMLGIKIYQAFGQEETSGFITRDRPSLELEPGYVGFKIRGIELKLTPQQELICRGPNVFKGYWRNPDTTKQIIQDGWYHTGIIADANPEGNWIIIGRMQNLIILNSGHNIAPEPIEKRIIENFTGVEQAILIGNAKPFLSLILSGNINPQILDKELEEYNKDLPYYLRIGGYYITDSEFDLKTETISENHKLKRREISGYFNQVIDQIYRNK